MTAISEKKLKLLAEEMDSFCKLVFSPVKYCTELVHKCDEISSATYTAQVEFLAMWGVI
jgi:hypothetical protein